MHLFQDFFFLPILLFFCILSPELSSIQQLPEPKQCNQKWRWQWDSQLFWDQHWRGTLSEAILYPIPGLRVDLAAEGQPWRQLQNHHGCQWVGSWGWFWVRTGTVPQRKGHDHPFHQGSLTQMDSNSKANGYGLGQRARHDFKLSCTLAVSPAHSSYSETMSTLRYASNAKNIINKPRVNEVRPSSEVLVCYPI